jgi:hypothetical protein
VFLRAIIRKLKAWGKLSLGRLLKTSLIETKTKEIAKNKANIK